MLTQVIGSIAMAIGLAGPDLDGLRFDQIQMIGTHNSYKLEADDGIDHVMLETGYKENANNDAARLKYRLAYQHLPLDVQLDLGIRVVELDVHADPLGGLYAEPGGHKAMAKFGMEPNTPYDPEGVMREPGFKVLHVPDWDFRSTCMTLRSCLGTIAEWSDRHEGHLPIMIRIEAKEKTMPVLAEAHEPTIVPRFDASAWRAMEDEMLEVLPGERVFRPSQYQDRWPTIAELRGKVIILTGGSKAALYRDTIGEQRLMFTTSEPAGGPRFASIPRNADPARFRAAEGVIVFASAETLETREARENDTERRDALFESRANIISTDFAVPDPRFSSYRVRFPDGTFVRPHPTLAD